MVSKFGERIKPNAGSEKGTWRKAVPFSELWQVRRKDRAEPWFGRCGERTRPNLRTPNSCRFEFQRKDWVAVSELGEKTRPNPGSELGERQVPFSGWFRVPTGNLVWQVWSSEKIPGKTLVRSWEKASSFLWLVQSSDRELGLAGVEFGEKTRPNPGSELGERQVPFSELRTILQVRSSAKGPGRTLIHIPILESLPWVFSPNSEPDFQTKVRPVPFSEPNFRTRVQPFSFSEL